MTTIAIVQALIAVEDFWSRVDRGGTCWLWRGGTRRGYPIFRGRPATRIAFELAFGEVPPGRHVRRRCASRRCVRPEHLVAADEHVRRRVHKLTALQADDVRARHAGGEPVADLARRYGITADHVRRIVSRKAWTGPRRPRPGSFPIVGREVGADGVDVDVLACGHRVVSTPWPNRWRRCRTCAA